MIFILFSMIILVASSLLAAFLQDQSKKAYVACLGASLGSFVGLLFLLPTNYALNSITFSTGIPLISFSFGLDTLSRFFLIVILGVSMLVGFYGLGYIRSHKKFSQTAPFFPLLVAAMAAVIVSRDGFSFLICWEIMSLVSFFLVISEHEDKEVQSAGWIYLIATHLATAFLMAFFVILAKASGSFLFSDYILPRTYTPFLAALLFIFAVIGFGTKAGIFPFHVWLPRAHPAAPSYISAIMSGVMIKTGIYGILRALTFLGAPPLWWGGLLVIVGVVSAVMGVLYALMQHDLKRLLAYHSVENIGIIVTGIGIGLMGISKGSPVMIALGFGGAIFHVLNHAIFKSLLFLSAGNISHAVHSLSIDRLGGLLRKIPVTAIAFLIAALSICGLPPFNGFISEWLVYMGLFKSSESLSGYSILISMIGILGIAFAGGLAVACFTKVFGVIFLGESRSEIPSDCREPSALMLFPNIILAVLCLLIGLYPQVVWQLAIAAAQIISPNLNPSYASETLSSLNYMSLVFVSLIVMAVLLLALRKFVFRKKPVTDAVTWDCGYAHPAASMQYTASSFAEPIGTFFKPILRPFMSFNKMSGFFPKKLDFEEHVNDPAEKGFFVPAFKFVGSVLFAIKKRKKSTIQNYLALIFITLIILFMLEVWFGV